MNASVKRVDASSLTIPSEADSTFDVVSLGEVMLRLDPGNARIRSARTFEAWEGGGEYNLTRALASTFGFRTAVATALVDNEIGRLVEHLIRSGGVSTELIDWRTFDGIGAEARNGLNFTERGYGVRPALGVSDRGHTAASQLGPSDIDWDALFSETGVRWLHTGGVFAGLSDLTAETVITATEAAHRHGVTVSYDVNFRPSLWQNRGGSDRAREVNAAVIDNVDVLFDFTAMTGLAAGHSSLETHSDDEVETLAAELHGRFPNLKFLANTVRRVTSASRNDFGGLAWSPEYGLHRSRIFNDMEIFDRVGGGDGFASGLVRSLLNGTGLDEAVETGAALGALVMTTPGDSAQVSAAEVDRLVGGAGAHVTR